MKYNNAHRQIHLGSSLITYYIRVRIQSTPIVLPPWIAPSTWKSTAAGAIGSSLAPYSLSPLSFRSSLSSSPG